VEDVVRKRRGADDLAAEGRSGEEIAAELGVSAATLGSWRRACSGMDTDAAKELDYLCEPTGQCTRLLAEVAREGCPSRGGQGKILSPAAIRRAVDVPKTTSGVSERWAQRFGLPVPPALGRRGRPPPLIRMPR
jgi:hypothetical protein